MYTQLRLSPDGTRVATYVLDADRDLWVIGLDGSFVQRLSAGPARDVMPVWSPDGSQIFFTTAERNINRIPADRSTGPQTIFRQPKPDRLHPLSITPDGKYLLTVWDIMPKGIDLRLLELGSTPQLKPLIGESGTERDAQLSRDGKWIVYQSAEAAAGARDGQIMVRPFPNLHAYRRIISPGVGRQPIWSRDGREIFYRTEDGSVMSVPIKTSQTAPYLTPGTPVRVVTPVNTIREWATGPNYDVSLDGRRFLFIKAPELDIHSLTVVLNWDVAVKAAIGGQPQ
jgi:Tol biopolymer transport system component